MKFMSSLVLACTLISGTAFADHSKEHDKKKEEMMKMFKEYSTPGDAHKMLSNMAGKWTYNSKWWQGSKATTPEESKGTSVIKMVLGGRFLHQEVKGTSMGMPYEGMGIIGYNNASKEYESTWMDNMGTGIMHGKGSFDQKTQTLTDKGEFTCPMKKNKEIDYRTEWKMIDKNNMTFTMYMDDMETDDEFKSMEMTYTRKK